MFEHSAQCIFHFSRKICNHNLVSLDPRQKSYRKAAKCALSIEEPLYACMYCNKSCRGK